MLIKRPKKDLTFFAKTFYIQCQTKAKNDRSSNVKTSSNLVKNTVPAKIGLYVLRKKMSVEAHWLFFGSR